MKTITEFKEYLRDVYMREVGHPPTTETRTHRTPIPFHYTYLWLTNYSHFSKLDSYDTEVLSDLLYTHTYVVSEYGNDSITSFYFYSFSGVIEVYVSSELDFITINTKSKFTFYSGSEHASKVYAWYLLLDRIVKKTILL